MKDWFAKKTAKPRPQNRIALVLDKSGSMQSVKRDVENAFNDVIQTIAQRSKEEDQDTRVSLFTFNSTVSRDFVDVDPQHLSPIRGSYYPVGQTALWDAIGMAVEDFNEPAIRKQEDVSYMVIVMTDGDENNSRSFNLKDIKSLLLAKQARGNWTFVFQVPPGAGSRTAERYGVPADNVREWEGTTRGVGETTIATQQGLSSYFGARSQGAQQVSSFYVQPNLKDLKPTTVKKELKDISHQFTQMSVNLGGPINQFVEKVLGTKYQLGSAYYQLTKAEKVQAGKQILLREKGKSAVWGGHEARELVGLPIGAPADVIPGDHGKYDIFVQSTSVNRKLVPGTTLLVQR